MGDSPIDSKRTIGRKVEDLTVQIERLEICVTLLREKIGSISYHQPVEMKPPAEKQIARVSASPIYQTLEVLNERLLITTISIENIIRDIEL